MPQNEIDTLASVLGYIQRRAESFRQQERALAGKDQWLAASVARVSAIECEQIIAGVEQAFLGEVTPEARMSRLQLFAAHYARLKDATTAARLARIGGG